MSDRKERWNQFGQQTKSWFKDTWKIWGSGLKNVATNIITGDFSGGVNSYMKMVGEEFKRTGQEYVDFFKALFNHPDWYKYHGRLPGLTMNLSRPFDPRGVENINGNDGSHSINPGIGIGHVIQNNFIVEDFRDTQAWKLAITEAFRINRMIMKSNLPYPQQVFEDYLFRAIHILMKAKQLERTLGWYYVAKGDIPELPEALSRVTHNYFEQGVLNYSEINVLKPSDLTVALTQFDKLRSILIQLSVPVKLAEYISYYAGSVFVDQSAPNPNMYINMIRNIPIYKTRDDGTLYQDGTWDIETGSIQELVDEAIDLLTKYGVVAADIAKTGLFGQILLQDVTTYKPVVLQDATFFTLLINNYTCSKDALRSTGLIRDGKDEFIRIDFLDSIGPENTIGVMNGLVTFCGAKSVFKLVSQALYLDAKNSDKVANMRLSGINDSGDTVNGELADIVSTDGYFIQMTTLVDLVNRFETVANATDVEVDVSADSRLAADAPAPGTIFYRGAVGRTYNVGDVFVDTPTNIVSIYNAKDDEYTSARFRVIMNDTSGIGMAIGTIYHGGNFIAVVAKVKITDGRVVSILDYTDSTSILANGGLSLTALGDGNYYIVVSNTTPPKPYLQFNSDARSMFVDMLRQQSPAVEWNFNDHFYCKYTTTSASIKYSICDDTLINMFCEQVDYHIPLVVTETHSVDGISYATLPKLMKETYIPVLLNNIDIENVLYWMYLGLFSVYDASRNMDDPHMNSGNRRRRQQRDASQHKQQDPDTK